MRNEEQFKKELLKLNKYRDVWLKKFPGTHLSAGMTDLFGIISCGFVALECKFFRHPKQTKTPLRPFRGVTPLQYQTCVEINQARGTALILSYGSAADKNNDRVYIVMPVQMDISVYEWTKGCCKNVSGHWFWVAPYSNIIFPVYVTAMDKLLETIRTIINKKKEL